MEYAVEYIILDSLNIYKAPPTAQEQWVSAHNNRRFIFMKVLELFAGTRSIGKAFEARGHEVFSVEWDKKFENINLYADIGQLTAQEVLEKFGHPDVMWMSFDCSSFSLAAISHHRKKNPITGNLDPITDYAKFCDQVDQHCLELIKELNPTYWFIENPVGGG